MKELVNRHLTQAISFGQNQKFRVLEYVEGRTRSATPFRGAGIAGFALIKLLVVITIIAILEAKLLPALRKVKVRAEGTCRINIERQLIFAGVMYAAMALRSCSRTLA